jgi:uncharacterized protein YjdB
MKNVKKSILLAVMFFITTNAYMQTVQPYIRIDQFGYRPNDKKVAVLADPQVGFNSADEFVPGSVYQIRSAEDNSVVFEGSPVVWNNGQTCVQSGDRGWWFEFSEVSDIGTYYVYDVEKNVKSYSFEIHPDIYKNMLKAATKMFYYQRLGIEKDAKYVGTKWADGYQQPMDSIARDIFDKDNPDKIRDLRGGWMDAGDQNKYTTFTVQPVHQLLSAYTQNPDVFTDDFDIPESGNGIPDIVDEVKWHFDWLKRMQDTIDGGTYIKMGGKVSFPLSKDTNPKYYFTPKSTAASIVASSMFAHGYLVFKEFPEYYDYAQDCKKRALKAWEFFHSTPMNIEIDDRSLGGGNANRDKNVQEREAVVAAIYLFAATGEQKFNDYILENYKNPGHWGIYDIHQSRAYLYYVSLPNADKALSMRIMTEKADSYKNNSGGWTKWDPTKDLYRAYMPNAQYHWGSNQPKGNIGNTLSHFLNFYILPEKRREIESHAMGFLHYFHGVNPVGITYLTNMEEYGADKSAKYAWHKWFNPDHCPPGYIPGGPNKNFKVDPSYPGTFSPPQNQPHQKSFRDWVSDWRTYPWEITEPAIYYQAAYVYLVSNFAQEVTETSVDVDSLEIFHFESDSLFAGIEKSLYLRKYPLAAWNAKISWQSSDNSIAIVDSLGVINPLQEGSVYIKAIAENGVSDSVLVHIKACSSESFNEFPHEIPGTIESEEFDKGCNTYFDRDATNNGKQFRLDEGVDIEITKDDRGMYNIGWIYPGEWLRYTVNVKETEKYLVECRVASMGTSQMKIEFNQGNQFTAPISLPGSGGYQNWFSHYTEPVELTQGQKTMTVSFLTDGLNINQLVFHKYVPVESISIPMDTLHLIKGNSTTLNADVTGGEGVITAVNWTTTDRTIAYVDLKGKVTAINPGIVTVKAISAVDGLTDSVVVMVADDYTAIPVVNAENVLLYPNPVSHGSFYLELPKHFAETFVVRITDILGKEVYRRNFRNEPGTPLMIETELNNGLYIVSVFGENISFAKKVVFNK